MGRESEIFTNLTREVITNPKILEVAKPGLCRIWSATAYASLANSGIPEGVKMEVREVPILASQTHSFLRLIIGEMGFLMDGTGVNQQPPFFGLEVDAPTHLLNSLPDGLINSDLAHFNSGLSGRP